MFSALADRLNSLNASSHPLSSPDPIMGFCTAGCRSLTFYNALECHYGDLVWPEQRMAFLPLWHADEISPSTELLPHKNTNAPTFSKHLPAALRALLRKTEVTLKQPWFCQAKTAHMVNRCPVASAHDCVCESKKEETPQGKYCVCAVLNSQENPWLSELYIS